jgi:hypothetical protein
MSAAALKAIQPRCSGGAFTAAHRARRTFTTEAMVALRDKGLTRKQAAAVLGVSDDAISARCRSDGVVWSQPSGLARYDDATFRRLWSCLSISSDEIGASVGVTGAAVRWRAKTLGLPTRVKNRRRKHDPELLREMWESGVRCADIARHFKMAHGACASVAARNLGLPPRVRGASGFRNGGWAENITLEQFMETRIARALAKVAAVEQQALHRLRGCK